jgi:S-adenosylhomocysteine hydrolase
MILDDGGDLTLLVHKGVEFEKAGKVPNFNAKSEPEEWGVILDTIRNSIAENPKRFTEMAKDIKGVSEETTTGVHRLYDMQKAGKLLFPCINVNDSATNTLENMLEVADIFITATGNKDIVTVDHMRRMKDKAIVANIGHFDNEIDMASLARDKNVRRHTIKPQYDEFVFGPSTFAGKKRPTHSVLVLAEGRLMNLGCATGHPSFVMSASFTNQVMAQLDLYFNATNKPTLSGQKYEPGQVYVLPKKLDEEVARLHLDKLGAKLTRLTKSQADYLGIPADGPYKADHYRY